MEAMGTAEEAKPLFTDAFVEDLNLLVEAKGSLDRQAVHMAIGQLVDYDAIAVGSNDLTGSAPTAAPNHGLFSEPNFNFYSSFDASGNAEGFVFFDFNSISLRTQVPEPSTLMLMGIGLVGLGWIGRRRKN